MRTEQLARDLAVLGPAAAAADADGEPATPAAAAVVVCREEGEVVPGCVVRGEVGGEEEQAWGCWEEGGEVGAGTGGCRRLWEVGVGFGLLCGGWFGGAFEEGCGRGEDARVEEAFVLEVGACRDEELGELARRVGARVDGRCEARPEGGAGVGEGREGAGGGAGEGVVDGGGEARPEVGGFLEGGVG